jgi:hypothetical protein
LFWKYAGRFVDLVNSQLKPIIKEINRLEREKKSLVYGKPTEGITDAMIETANEFPIEELLDINNRGFARCIWHDDKNPSMYCKNNFAHCFSCGKTGSVITVYMQLNNVNFKEAVKHLSI